MTFANTPPEAIPVNAFLIHPKKGAMKALKAINADLKRAGCHWHTTDAWSCPIEAQDVVRALLEAKQIGVEIVPIKDDYFDKSKSGQEAKKHGPRLTSRKSNITPKIEL